MGYSLAPPNSQSLCYTLSCSPADTTSLALANVGKQSLSYIQLKQSCGRVKTCEIASGSIKEFLPGESYRLSQNAFLRGKVNHARSSSQEFSTLSVIYHTAISATDRTLHPAFPLLLPSRR